jgi:hypothetical protein
VLISMQERLVGGPHAALGVSPAASPAEIRAAFLALTKTYHPARFGYMSAELQRLSNEVFLSLRAAHDALARPARAAAAARADRSGAYPRTERSSGQFPAVVVPKSERSGPLSAPLRSDRSGPIAAVAAPPRSDRGSSQFPAVAAPPRSDRGSSQFPAVAAPPRSDRSSSQFPAVATPASGVPLPVPSDAPSRSFRVTQTSTPPAGVRIGAGRPTGAPPTGQPAASPAASPLQAGSDRELAGVYEQLQRGQWAAARTLLSVLVARTPGVPRYLALLCYARGREAQLAHRLDEARVELQAALQLDPELALAKTALAELFTRRK